MSTDYGRLNKDLVGKQLSDDAPELKVAAMLSKQDDLIAAIKALTAKLDADAGVTDTDYASTISDGINLLDFTP